MHIYHITSADAWRRAMDQGDYRPPSLEAEGFIHCSTRAQLPLVADALFRGQSGLVVLCIDSHRTRAPVRWEPAAPPPGAEPPPLPSDARVPHVYGPLEPEAVVAAHELEPGADGRLRLPAALDG